MTKDNGGPAFPNPALADENYRPQPGDDGMSLRDWFAGQALLVFARHRGPTVAAKEAYNYADAMLKARVTTLDSADFSEEGLK